MITAPALSPGSLPGPRGMPVLSWIGNAALFMREPMRYMLRLYADYGPIVALARGDSHFIFAFGPQHNHQLLSDLSQFRALDKLTSPFQPPPDSAHARLMQGLPGMNPPQHTRQRQLMMPAFHKKRVESYRDAMIGLIEQRLDEWRAGEQREMLREMKHLAMSIALKTLLGLDPHSEGLVVRDLVERWLQTSLAPQTMLLAFDLPGTRFRRTLRIAEQIEHALLALIEQKRACGGDDVLATLIHAHDEGGQMSTSELIGQTMTLFVAGHETTANALAWTLFLLDQHPRVASDLLDELHGALRGAAPTVEQLGALPLLDRVLKESLRLFSPVMWFGRVATHPFDLGPYRLPAETTLIYSPAVTHRIPSLYARPNAFLPQRWERLSPSAYEFLPFGAGPRMCIGASFATMEMKLVLASLLQRYRLAIPARTTLDRGGMLLSALTPGLPMVINRQDRRFSKGEVRGGIHTLLDQQ